MNGGFYLGKMKVLAVISNDSDKEFIKPLGQEILCNADASHILEAEMYFRHGKMLFDGKNVEADVPKACRYFEIAYDMGSRNIRSGDYLMMGMYRLLGVPEGFRNGLYKDVKLAIKWFSEGLDRCERNFDLHGMNLMHSRLGRSYLYDEVKDYEKAYAHLMFASIQECEALFYLAKMYDRGLYVEEDRLKAADFLDRILDTPGFEDDVFFDAAKAILESWEMGEPDEVVDEIYRQLD